MQKTILLIRLRISFKIELVCYTSLGIYTLSNK